MNGTVSGGLGFFGLWQVLNLVLHTGIDAPWNRVQNWPEWDWWNLHSVAYPTVLGLTVAAVLLALAGIAWLVSEVF